MKKILTITLFMLATLAWAAAQQPSNPPDRSGGQARSQNPAANAPVTEGCLGGSAPNFTLTDKAGTTYKLNIPSTADTSKLGQHVGEPVAVAGNVNGKAGNASIDVQSIGRVVWLNAPSSDLAETDPRYAYPPPDNSSANIAYEQQQEIDLLNDEVKRLRAERASASPSQESPAAQILAETVLVFRDRHSEEIQNYAITGNTLWVFTQERGRKIPIAELDVPATAKANADRGIDFRLPQPRRRRHSP